MDAPNWHTCFFLLFAAAACGFALAIVLAKNIVHMAFCLVACLGAVAGLYFLAGADFVGAMQLMVYVGGTVVLLIFGVMLTARSPFVSMETGAAQWMLAAVVGSALFLMLVLTTLSVDEWAVSSPAAPGTRTHLEPTATPLGLGMLGVRVDRLAQGDPTLRAGMSGYLLPFEIVSVHLLVVLIAAAYLARTRRKVGLRISHRHREEGG